MAVSGRQIAANSNAQAHDPAPHMPASSRSTLRKELHYLFMNQPAGRPQCLRLLKARTETWSRARPTRTEALLAADGVRLDVR